MILGNKKAIIDAINENEENLELKMSLCSDNIVKNANEKFKELTEKVEKTLSKIDTGKEKYEEKIRILEQERDKYQKMAATSKSQVGGLQAAKNNAVKKCEELKQQYEERLRKKQTTIDEQNELIQKLTSELNQLKNKKPTPTIEELKEYQTFHGKRKNKKK